jgi:hypothetical protein
MSIKWGLSVLDWRDHAINDHHDHPTGVYKAQCGHSLMMVTHCGTHRAGLNARRAPTQSPLRVRHPKSPDRSPGWAGKPPPSNAASSRVLPGGRSVPTK